MIIQREILLDMGGDGIGIDGRHQRDGVLLIRITDSWQRLHHQPTRIVGVLDGYLGIFSALRLLALLVQEEFAQVEVLLTLLMQGDRQGVHHEFTVAQNRQIVLFTIAVAITGSHHLINIYAFFQSLDIKGDGSRALGIDAVILRLLPNHLVGLRVENLHTGVAAHLLVGSIEEFHHDSCLIALTQEARHVRLHHHGLLSHSLIHQQTVAHLLVMSQAHELPGSHALRQGKPDGYVAIVVALQGRIEEGGLVHILTHLHFVKVLSCIRTRTTYKLRHLLYCIKNLVGRWSSRCNTDHITPTSFHDSPFFLNQLVFLNTNRLNGSARRTFQFAQFHRLHISIIAKEFAIKLIHIQSLLVIILGRINAIQVR